MNLTGIVYRPPYEADSLLLQVTQGCSHNKCTFCYMYPEVQFSVCPMEQVEADIDEYARYRPSARRVFLEHGDAFVLSADRLLKIAEAIHRKLPQVETISMYASIQNIKGKTDEELRQLRAAGIHGLDIGVERKRRRHRPAYQRGAAAPAVHRQLACRTRLQAVSGYENRRF
ncbi:MAG: radical SAM protein [Clostridia bacterium]|nr:radical SAM protein [Clostridia bacterium]